MAKNTNNKAKPTKAERRRTAKRNRLIRQFGIYGVMIALCIACLILIPVMNRPIDRQVTWTPADGAAAMNEAPVPETPAPTAIPEVKEAAETDAAEDADGDLPDEGGEADFVSFDGEAAEGIATGFEDADLDPGFDDRTDELSTPAAAVDITLTAAGDCTFGGCLKHDTYKVFKKYVDENGYDYFLKNVRALFQSDDLTIINLEGPLTDVGTMTTKSGICFRGDPEWTAIMTGSSVELCNFANNHNMDMGQEGFDRTLKSLDDAGIGYCVYDKVYRTTIKGVRVTALGFDKWANKQDQVVAAIQQERPNCDLLIVNFHWGREMHYEAMSDQKSMAHAIVDAGADLVIGTHPHVFGGVEVYKGKYIAYSLGNFCFGGNTVPSDQRAMIFQQVFHFENGQLTDGGVNIIPCLVSGNTKRNDFQPYILDAKAGTALLKKIAHYSINVKELKWMPGSYPEQIGLIQGTGATSAAVPLVSAEPTIIPADQVFTAEDGFDTVTHPQPGPTPTMEPLDGLGDRTLTEEETSALQEQIYLNQMSGN